MKTQIKIYWKWIVLFPLIGLCGCAGTALQHDYTNYSEVYGDSNNKQMLLNLAREAHEEPIYFIQLASISSQYQFTTSASLNSSYGFNSPSFYPASQSATTGATPPTGGDTVSSAVGEFIRHPITLGGSVNSGFTQTPVFSFIPLTGTNLSQAVSFPIPEKVFDTFYDQDWQADWLARLMVESVVHESITTKTNLNSPIYSTNYTALLITNDISAILFTNKDTTVIPMLSTNYRAILIVNSITTNYAIVITIHTNYDYWVNDPRNSTYPQFLKFCDTLRYAQQNRYINLEQGTGSNTVYNSKSTKLADVLSALTSGLSVKYDITSENIVVSKPNQDYKFVLNLPSAPSFSASINKLKTDVSTLETKREQDQFAPSQAIADQALAILATNVSEGVDFITTNYIAEKPEIRQIQIEAKAISILATNAGASVEFMKARYSNNDLTNSPIYNDATNIATYLNLDDLASRISSGHIKLKMRTFEAVLYGAANEQHEFDSKTNDLDPDITYRASNYGSIATITNYPGRIYEVRPILMIHYDEGARTNLQKLVEVDHDGTRYTIGDLEGDNAKKIDTFYEHEDNDYQNRTVFSIINYLFLDTTINSQSLPVQQLIQVQ